MARRRPPLPSRIFLLSPANCTGRRARLVVAPGAQFALAKELHSRQGAALGDLFSFISGLYFRGKLAYARRFARPPDPDDPITAGGVLVITPNAGLRAADTRVTLEAFRAFSDARIDLGDASYRQPLERAAHALQRTVGPQCEVVLLGSVATGKYVDLLLPIFQRHLVFPGHFVGRGDMSRGGLMLRCAAAGLELDYVPLEGAVRHGKRPPKLEPIRTTKTTKIAKGTRA